MKWAELNIQFARPMNSIVALLGKQVISFKLGNLKSGRNSRGHYFMAPGRIKVASADDYVEKLREAYVLVDIDERKALLRQEINGVADQLGGRILPDEELVDINTNLVETPIAGAGKFDDAFLEVPDEVLINAMREHQKYFSVVDTDDKLLPCFIAVNNTRAKDMALVTQGHERVIRARLADAQFFYRGDLEVSNDQRVQKLKGVLFQAQLGTMFEKSERVSQLAAYIASDTGKAAKLKDQAVRAAWLCKSDLVSQVVGEFPKLQGIMGRVYAAKSGEHPDVAAAIEEHYRPVYSGAPLPQTVTGAIISIADKIDSICGCFSVGLVPTGASDPYALRRQGIGIIQIMNDKGFAFSLSELIQTSLNLFGKHVRSETDALVANIYQFFANRISHLLVEDGFSKDVVSAVVSVSVDAVPSAWHRVRALESLKAKPDFQPLVAGFKRVSNILKKSGGIDATAQPASVDESLFDNEAESGLLAACQKAEVKVTAAVKSALFDDALLTIASLRGSVDAFFDGVMVMTDDRQVRDNRLALLARTARLFESFADFSKIAT
jgi:glycyl-tRNA synthetase beta chain